MTWTQNLKKIKLKRWEMAEINSAQVAPTQEHGEKRAADKVEADEQQLTKKQKFEAATYMQGRADRKRKCALLLAYCGAGYYGIQMQRNNQFKTIEGELIKALLTAGLIMDDHAETPSKMSFQRSARTDKNVSAAGNVISLKMLYDEEVSEKINAHLPPEIRVIGVLRTTKGFDSKNHCTARTYKYMLPTYAFAPVEKFVTKDYRATGDIMQRVNEVLGMYVGTHNFHNFTSGKKPNDPSSKRYIISFECAEPFVTDGMEFAVMTVKGQSFMLHHIRKMIGLMISIVRGYCSDEVLLKSWGPMKMDIPKAPGMGLFLDELFFQGYNNKFGNDGMHEPLVWDKYREALNTFKGERIISRIAESELKESNMLKWLGTLQFHKFDIIDPNLPVPPDGEKEKDQNWYKTKYLLSKLDKAKKESVSTLTDQETTNRPADSITADDTTVAVETSAEHLVAKMTETVGDKPETGISGQEKADSKAKTECAEEIKEKEHECTKEKQHRISS